LLFDQKTGGRAKKVPEFHEISINFQYSEVGLLLAVLVCFCCFGCCCSVFGAKVVGVVIACFCSPSAGLAASAVLAALAALVAFLWHRED